MALPATDTFDGTGALSANWTVDVGTFTRTSGVCYSTASTNALAYWNADSFAAAQYGKGTISGLVSYDYIGVSTRCDGSSNGYTNYTKDTTAFIVRVDTGSETTLDTDTGTPYSNGDVIGLQSDGSVHTGYNNGSPVTAFNATDSTYTTGSPGLSGYFNGPASGLTDWEGGNLGAGGGYNKHNNLLLLGAG